MQETATAIQSFCQMHFKLYLLKEAEYKVDTIAIQRFYPFKWAISKFKYISDHRVTDQICKANFLCLFQ